MNDMQLFSLNGKTAVVTGGFGNLGPVFIVALYNAGASVAVLDLPGKKPPEDLITLERTSGGKIQFYEADVTSKTQLTEVREKIKKEIGIIRILVNNAGIDAPPVAVQKTYTLVDFPLESANTIFSVNTLGSFLCMQVFGEEMVNAKSGSIINIGSLYASVSPDAHFYDHLPSEPPFLKPPAYGASKAALYNLTKYFATHWGRLGVRVNMLSPGGIDGGQDPAFKKKFSARVPLGRLGAKEDLCGPIVFLASDASRYITGENLKVDGGFTAW